MNELAWYKLDRNNKEYYISVANSTDSYNYFVICLQTEPEQIEYTRELPTWLAPHIDEFGDLLETLEDFDSLILMYNPTHSHSYPLRYDFDGIHVLEAYPVDMIPQEVTYPPLVALQDFANLLTGYVAYNITFSATC